MIKPIIAVPLVSVIMPAFNCEKFVESAILSVISQTYQNWELIIINDCSNDNTVQKIKALIHNNNRIRFYENDVNKGVSLTRNMGVNLSRGDWIAFLDSDDMWQASKLAKQISLINATNSEFVFTGVSYVNEHGEAYLGTFEVPSEVNFKKLRTHNVISCSSVLIKKRFFETLKMENDNMHEDYALWLRILQTGINAYGINEPLLIYRISKNSKSGNKLRSITMSYKVFRFIGINHIGSAYFLSRHLINSFFKYRKIKFNN